MKYGLLFLLLCIFFLPRNAQATTWDEPWQETILKEATCFVKARVLACNQEDEAEIEVIQSWGSEKVRGKLKIRGFFLLHLCSSSAGHGPELHLREGMTYYFFLKNKGKDYQLPTPTSGFARLEKGQVFATYRHSYHQALMQEADYEATMSEIWAWYRTGKYDKAWVSGFLDRALNQAPASLETDESAPVFFMQHAALEMILHLRIGDRVAQILPFLKDAENFHAQTSAVRALTYADTPEANAALIAVLQDTSCTPFVHTMAVWALREHTLRTEDLSLLRDIAARLRDEDAGFGGNIMDPRVCTRVPSPADAARTLLEKQH